MTGPVWADDEAKDEGDTRFAQILGLCQTYPGRTLVVKHNMPFLEGAVYQTALRGLEKDRYKNNPSTGSLKISSRPHSGKIFRVDVLAVWVPEG